MERYRIRQKLRISIKQLEEKPERGWFKPIGAYKPLSFFLSTTKSPAGSPLRSSNGSSFSSESKCYSWRTCYSLPSKGNKKESSMYLLSVCCSLAEKISDEHQTFLINKNKLFKLIYCLIPFILKLNKNHSIGWQVMST